MGISHLRPIQLGVGLLLSIAVAAGCRTGVPVVDRGEKPPTQDGTIAGHVRTEGSAALVGRVVRAVGVDSNQKFEVSTNVAGTYTLKVPPGRYRLEVEVRAGERIVKEPGETTVHKSDLDPDRDFVIGVGP